VPSPALGQRKAVGQTFDNILGWSPAMGDVLRLTFHGIATYLGIWVGVNANKIKWSSKSAKIVTIGLGYALAGGQGLGAIADIISLVKRATGTHPPEEPSPPVSAISPIPPVK